MCSGNESAKIGTLALISSISLRVDIKGRFPKVSWRIATSSILLNSSPAVTNWPSHICIN
jgi:hypothetical protein